LAHFAEAESLEAEASNEMIQFAMLAN